MKRRYSTLMVVALMALAASPAWTNHEAEVWRSPFGMVRSVSVDPADGSCWAAVGSWVIHYAEDGTVLSRTNLWYPRSVSANSADGSCWVADQGHSGPSMWSGPSEVIHLAADGSELSRTGGFLCPLSVSVNPIDGSCWVGDLGEYDSVSGVHTASTVAHLAEDGTELWRDISGMFHAVLAVAVRPSDGSCWVADIQADASNESGSYLLHLASDGSLLWRSGVLGAASSRLWTGLNESDGSVWAMAGPILSHFGADGSVLWQVTDDGEAYAVGVDAVDGSLWLPSRDMASVPWLPYLRHLAADGTELWRGTSLHSDFRYAYEQSIAGYPVNPSVNPTDHALWLGGMGPGPDRGTEEPAIAHYGADGGELWREQVEMDSPCSPSVTPEDGAVWFEDAGNGRAVRLGPGGAELLRGVKAYNLRGPWLEVGGPLPRLAAYPNDGSCWLVDRGTDLAQGDLGSQLVRLGVDGAELAHTPLLPAHCRIDALAVDPRDGSVWMTYYTPDSDSDPAIANLAHYSSGGGLLWSKTYGQEVGWERSVALNPADGSVWFATVARSWAGIVHLDQSGRELWRGGQVDLLTGTFPLSVTVSPKDGACWAVYSTGFSGDPPSSTDLVCFNTDGRERWRRSDLCVASMAFDPVTDLCWAVSDMEIVILDRNGRELWRTGGFGPWPQGLSVNVVDGACWVTDSLNDQIVKLKLPGPFRDVPFFNWAADAIAACVTAGIVGGYPDGWYHPELTVTRDQMAVFISRALAGGDANVPPGPGSATFTDVPTDYWAFKYVEYAKSQGVVGGYSNGTYRPTLPVTRDQMAVFVARAMAGGDSGVPTGPATATFPDVPTDFWAFRYVEYAKANSVVGGYPDGWYHPELTVTRDQMAVFVQRAFELPM